MAGDKFVYVTFIRTTPEALWEALTNPEFTRKYWFGVVMDSEWKVGAPWKMLYPDGTITDKGEILEYDPPKRIVIRWQNEFRPELKAEGFSRCVIEIEPVDRAVKLTIAHTIDVDDSKLIVAVSGGWPKILSNLKSLLETGDVVLT
jgi:uncharacterized protein YndB with AHSA1/START domain